MTLMWRKSPVAITPTAIVWYCDTCQLVGLAPDAETFLPLITAHDHAKPIQ